LNEPLSSKRYEPPIIDLDNKNSSQILTIDLTGVHKKVLEIGTSTGYISKILKERGNIVTGIEIDHEAGLIAQQYCDRMIFGDVEALALNKKLEPASFDVILCGDVLEHLKNPVKILQKLQKFLKPDGYLVVSLPNFCHGDVLLNLLNGDFRYTSIGLLDETHLRFFGLKNIFALFAECGYQISDLHTTNLDIGNTELKINQEKVPQDLLKFIRSLPNSNVYQYVFIASPSANVKIPNFNDIDLNKLFYNSIEESIHAEQFLLLQELSTKDQHLQEISAQVTILNQTLAVKDQQILEISAQVTILNQTLAVKDQQILEISAQVTNLNQTLAVKDQQILEISAQITNLNQTLTDKDQQILEISAQITNLNQTLAVKDQQILEISAQITNLNQTLTDKDQQILEISAQITNLNQTLTDKDKLLQELSSDFYNQEQKLSSIKKSMVWQFTMKFHTKVIERLLPHTSRRRKIYDLGLKGGRLFVDEGFKKTYTEFKNYMHMKRSLKKLIETTQNKELKYLNTNLDISKVESEKTLIEKSDLFLSEQRRLIFPKYEKPLVSIIILTFNKAAYTYQCLRSLIENTNIPFEVILVDNKSTDNTQELLKRVDNVVQIANDKNLGFLQGCNQGAIPAKGKYLLFLNNDTAVTKDWLSQLVSTADSNAHYGAVGCKLVWPNGQLQEAGSIIWRDGSASGYGRGDDPLKPEYSYLREIDFCSGACLLVRTDLFKILKGFDERYIPAYYEDADLCLGIQNLGYMIIYQPKVTIFHHEFTSSSKEHATKYMVNNQSKFIEKWQDYLKRKEINSPTTLLNARDIRKGKKILVIDDRIPASNQGSGYPRANTLLRYLGELGCKVTFFPLANTTPWQPYTSQFQDLGIEVLYGDYLNFEEFSQQRSNFYDMVIVSRPHNFERSFQIIKSYFPNAYLIYDAEALFSTRELLKAKVEGVTLDDNQIRNLRDKEFELMKKADLIITVSENERKIIQETGGIDNIIIFGYPVQVQKSIAGYNARKDILFVGSFLALDGPNDDAIMYFVKEIWPNVQKQLLCKLYIVGINPPENIKKLASESIMVTGFVPNLEEYYNNCRVFVVPHRYAAGIPLKLIEAMSYGIPSVVSGIIGFQLNLKDGNEVTIAGNTSEFVNKIIHLYQNQNLWEKMQQKSIEYIRQTCDPEKTKNDIRIVLIKL
jgi:GT2 family glycosyltransferase/SAM-dependent methyltransferase